MSNAAPFADWMRQRRKALDLTQQELADRTGASFETIRKIEEGKRRPSKQMANLISQQLGVPEEERPALVRLARHDVGGGEVRAGLLDELAEEIAAGLLAAAKGHGGQVAVKVTTSKEGLAGSAGAVTLTILLEPVGGQRVTVLRPFGSPQVPGYMAAS